MDKRHQGRIHQGTSRVVGQFAAFNKDGVQPILGKQDNTVRQYGEQHAMTHHQQWPEGELGKHGHG